MLEAILILAVWLIPTIIFAVWYFRTAPIEASRERLESSDQDRATIEASARLEDERATGIGRWLYLAGYRTDAALPVYLFFQLSFLLIGFLLAFSLIRARVLERVLENLAQFPGGFFDIVLPLLAIMPWLFVVVIGLIPVLWVRARRRRRVSEIERDLPVTLELLSTLAESGLGFDAALERVLRSQPSERLLAQEFRIFQAEVRSGRPRLRSLRRLSHRIEISSVNMLVSALVQAEQVGSGISAVLRRQAEELRSRRRERATEFAMALPVKRMIPMVFCFLPALFVAALGPSLMKIFETVNVLTRGVQ